MSSEQICKPCHFTQMGMFVSQGFTSYECESCNKKDMYHDSAIPKHCDLCAKQKNICRRCGKQISDNERK